VREGLRRRTVRYVTKEQARRPQSRAEGGCEKAREAEDGVGQRHRLPAVCRRKELSSTRDALYDSRSQASSLSGFKARSAEIAAAHVLMLYPPRSEA